MSAITSDRSRDGAEPAEGGRLNAAGAGAAAAAAVMVAAALAPASGGDDGGGCVPCACCEASAYCEARTLR